MIKHLAIAMLLAGAAGSVAARTVTADFESIRGAKSGTPLNDLSPGYAGVAWDGRFSLLSSAALGGGTPDSRFGKWALSSTSHENWITPNFPTDYSFDLIGADIASLSKGAHFDIIGYRNGFQAWSRSVTVGITPTHLSFDWKDTDGVVIYGEEGTSLILDNVILGVSPVPEPDTIALMAMGLVALLLKGRKRESVV